MILKLIRQTKNATKYSIDGFKHLVSSEFAARIEIYFYIWFLVFLWLVGAPFHLFLGGTILFLVLIAVESLNTAVEVIIDRITPEISETGKRAKDLGSFSVMCVLIACIAFIIYAIKIMGVTTVFTEVFSPKGKAVITLVALVCGISHFAKGQVGNISKLLLVSITALSLLALSIFYSSNYFSGNGVDESVIYHLGVGLEGAGLLEYWSLILTNIIFVILSVIALFYIVDLLGQKKRKLSQIFFKINKWNDEKLLAKPYEGFRSHKVIGTGFYIIALAFNPLTMNALTIFEAQRSANASLDFDVEDFDHFVAPENVTFNPKKNLVYLYVEGLERTYLDENLFPNLVPNIKALETESISFTDIRPVFGTGYTIGGIVASQCGVPIFTPSGHNSSGNFDQFMPSAVCLGDILKKNKVRTAFMGGARLKFAGKGQFLKTHGFDEVLGYEHHVKSHDEKKDFHAWGLYDSFLFSSFYEKFTELSKARKPFALFGLTLDTHAPRGHLSPACKDTIYQDGKNDMLNAVKCSDKMVTDMIKKIRASQYADNTLIVIASDHLALKNRASDILKQGNRKNLFLVIDPSNDQPRTITRKGSVLDTGTTALSLLGFSGDQIGYGRNLLSEPQTIIEVLPKSYNAFLLSQRESLGALLWDTPNLEEGVGFDLEKNRILFGGNRWMNLPAMLIIDEEGRITDVEFDHPNELYSAEYLGKAIPKEGRILWIDDCMIMDNFDVDITNASSNEDDWCFAIRKYNQSSLTASLISHDHKVSKQSLQLSLGLQ